MKTQRILYSAGAAVGMLVLILDSSTALAGAKKGIELCINSLIPSLFPFFVLSNLLTGALNGWTCRMLKPLCKLCKIPSGSESVLLTGLLGGYPVGAQCVGYSYAAGTIDRQTASRMLGFCNNAGPAFLFGVIGHAFDSVYIPWLLWAIHVTSALIVGTLLPGNTQEKVINHVAPVTTWPQALRKAISVCASVCGWVILFRIALSYLNKWLFYQLPAEAIVLLSGLLELTNGCVQLQLISNTGLRFILAAVLLASGGVCVALQTCSVIHTLPINSYCVGKALQTAFSFLLAGICQILLPQQLRYHIPTGLLVLVLVIAFLLIFWLKKQWNFPGIWCIIKPSKQRGNCHVIPKED